MAKRDWETASESELIRETQLEQEASCHPLMMAMLRLAVPLHAARLAQLPFEQRAASAVELARLLSGPDSSSLADGPPGKKGARASMFNALAEALAIGSLQPCGVTWGGEHWEYRGHEG
jgi:hypothetical protein